MHKFHLHVAAEWESGLYVSKDVIAEEVESLLVGNTIENEEGLQATLTDVYYNGSRQGKPLEFEVSVELDQGDTDADWDEFEEKLTELVEGESIQCQHDNSDQPTDYSLSVYLSQYFEDVDHT